MKTEIEALREALNAAIGYINVLEGIEDGLRHVADDDTLEENFDEAITNLLELGYLPSENE